MNRAIRAFAITAVMELVAASCFATCAFPAARGVLQRFAGEDVAAKFSFVRMESAEPQ